MPISEKKRYCCFLVIGIAWIDKSKFSAVVFGSNIKKPTQFLGRFLVFELKNQYKLKVNVVLPLITIVATPSEEIVVSALYS